MEPRHFIFYNLRYNFSFFMDPRHFSRTLDILPSTLEFLPSTLDSRPKPKLDGTTFQILKIYTIMIITDIFSCNLFRCHSWSFVAIRGHSQSLVVMVVTSGHSWSLGSSENKIHLDQSQNLAKRSSWNLACSGWHLIGFQRCWASHCNGWNCRLDWELFALRREVGVLALHLCHYRWCLA